MQIDVIERFQDSIYDCLTVVRGFSLLKQDLRTRLINSRADIRALLYDIIKSIAMVRKLGVENRVI